jgi:hypothetical protein
LFEWGLLRAFKFIAISLLLFSLALVRPAYSASLSLVVAPERQTYDVAETVNITGGVNNGSAVPDALVLFEVDTPKHAPWIIRTFTTGQAPAGPWPVQLLSVIPTDAFGDPVYAFNPGQDAGFNVTVRNNALSTYPNVVVTINVFFSNGLPFVLQTMVNTTLSPGQTLSSVTWPISIPVNSVLGQAMVYASVFNNYPKNGGLPYSPEQSAAFNITSGIPQQTQPSSPLGNFSFTVPLSSTPSMPIWLGNYTVYATTHYGALLASAQTIFTVKLIGDITGPLGVPDGKVDIRDISMVGRHFATYSGGPNWDPRCDLTGVIPLVPDGKVDIRDISLVAKAFGIVAKLP